MWSVRVFDPQLLAKVQAGALADCIWASMDVYIKLVKINPRRVRGRRCIDGVPEATNHYWVEAGDTVFDYHGGVAQTLTKSLFYRTMNINPDMVKYAEWGMLFEAELACNTSDELKLYIKHTLNRDWLQGLAAIYRTLQQEN